jgi:hypothetical protein
MQLPQKYKENFDVSSDGPSSIRVHELGQRKDNSSDNSSVYKRRKQTAQLG